MLPVKHNCKATFAVGLADEYCLVVPVEKSAAPGRKIRELRRSKGLTQQELADIVGKKRPMISEWENGQGLTVKNLQLIAHALGVLPSDIGDAWDPEGPRPSRRQTQLDHPPAQQTHVAAPPPQNPTGVDMGPGDQALFAQVEGAWKLLRNDEERRAFVEHVRGFVHQSTAPEASRKKAVR